MGMRKSQECTALWNISPGFAFKKSSCTKTNLSHSKEEHAVLLLGLKNYTYRLKVYKKREASISLLQ